MLWFFFFFFFCILYSLSLRLKYQFFTRHTRIFKPCTVLRVHTFQCKYQVLRRYYQHQQGKASSQKKTKKYHSRHSSHQILDTMAAIEATWDSVSSERDEYICEVVLMKYYEHYYYYYNYYYHHYICILIVLRLFFY